MVPRAPTVAGRNKRKEKPMTTHPETVNADAATGVAAGVPFVAVPPSEGARASAPVVLAWHLLDPPRTERALAAALPLRGLDAWRVYLGLPLSGSRLPAGGPDELMRLGYEDAVMNIHAPVAYGAAEELAPAFAELRERLLLGDGPVGVMGGSSGAAVAQLVLAESDLDVRAAVLVSPVVRLRGAVGAMERRFGVTYPWSEESNAIADRLDFVARAPEIARRNDPAVLLVVGDEDDPEFHEDAAELQAALARAGGGEDRARVVTVPGMPHALAEEPGVDPAPQTPHAAAVDRLAVDWLDRHLAREG
jgi:pimeloyl-ACP methyl ester carboxylesterase